MFFQTSAKRRSAAQISCDMGQGDVLMLFFGTFLGKVFGKDRIPIKDVLDCVVKGISEITRSTFFCVNITSWTQDECDDLLAIVIQNSQVYYILNNIDGLRFYQRVLRESDNLTKNAKSERKFGKIETRSKP